MAMYCAKCRVSMADDTPGCVSCGGAVAPWQQPTRIPVLPPDPPGVDGGTVVFTTAGMAIGAIIGWFLGGTWWAVGGGAIGFVLFWV